MSDFFVSYEASTTHPAFTVERITPANLNGTELELRSRAITHVLRSGWEQKFEPDVLTSADLDRKIPSGIDQWRMIAEPSRNAHYFLAYDEGDIMDEGLLVPEDAHTMLRVEEWVPRNPFKKPYPNITDLETVTGTFTGQHERSVAATLYFGLLGYPGNRKVSVYSEAPNREGIAYFENLAFHQTGRTPSERIGTHTMTYVQLEAASVDETRRQLRYQYPWLARPLKQS